MGKEIERKFLVRDDSWKPSVEKSTHLCQKYIPLAPGLSGVVRIRIAGDRAFLTLKGARKGIECSEFEYPVPVADAEKIMELLCPGHAVDKVRNVVMYQGKRWEIDVFSGTHAGLILAEIELESADSPFERPPWLGEEVSGDFRYSNSYLAEHS